MEVIDNYMHNLKGKVALITGATRGYNPIRRNYCTEQHHRGFYGKERFI